MRTWDGWKKRHADGEPIDLRHYEAIGTMKEALSQHAEEAYRELADEKGRQIAERMFKSLTDLGSDARGVRSPRPLEEICALTDASQAEVVEVVEAFRRPGRSFLMPPASHALQAGSIVDISHESLMRIWKRLIHWVDEEARSAQMYLRISRGAAQFQEGKAGLLHDPELQLALNWREETRPNAVWAQRYDVAFERAMVFLEQSRRQRDLVAEEKERQRRRQLQWARRLAVVLGLGALVTLVFGLYAMTARMEAEQNFKEAMRQKSIADQQRKEAESQRQLADVQSQKADQARMTAEQQRLLAESQRQRAQQEEQEALRQKSQADAARALETKARTEAEQQRLLAVQQRERADTLRTQAQQSESEARRLRVLSVARELAIKTSQLVGEDQRQLAALLAVEAYRLHTRSGGDPSDPDIFEALRAAVARVAPGEVRVLRYHTDAVRSLATAASGLVASGSDDGTVRLLDLGRRGAAPRLLGSPGSEVRALAWTEGGRLAVGSLDGDVRIYDASGSGSALATLVAQPGGVTALAALKGDGLAAGGLDGHVGLWKALAGPASTLPATAGSGRIEDLAAVPRGPLAAASMGKGILLWDLAPQPAARQPLVPDRRIHALDVSADGKLAAGTEEGPILLWPAGLARPPVELSGHTAAVTSVSFAPDGKRLASSSLDGSVRLWEVNHPDHKPIRLSGHSGWVWAVVFTADGETLVSGGADRSVRVWPTRPQPLAKAVCAHETRNLTPEEWSAFLPADIAWEATCP